ncbi:hypothetical protein PF005_g7306 [Phytophthora fragariae]|uniref:Uncharacterized protein n=1 Tax=Phytophthora fragariae TaxID=53985 RepID=A0A6A3ZUJ5_9STRA|nr:hypothetical protein PF003_g40032 [Phytophthora fragariae]KAE8941778.1 hypothetical protein PF009_g8438 [Phytophthora fragariae]KAE9017937.1 hypothetical protein PF011_g6473 [Phytophthora fragariae]KAE9121157.1 hypothetical protein PF007_g7913 [Phytophthora fragariae]KAE9122389.1 hypothetical protein PF010_g6748 [Phytophthora fragariae]
MPRKRKAGTVEAADRQTEGESPPGRLLHRPQSPATECTASAEQAPDSPEAEKKLGAGARVATTRSIRVGSAYNSAVSYAGEESAGDTEDKKTDTRSQETGK